MATIMWLIPIIISIVGSVAAIVSVTQTKRKMQSENEDKMASKSYVLDKISKVDTEIVNLKENFKQHKIDNAKDKEELKEGYKTEFSYIRSALDDIKEDLKIIKSKSA